MQTLEKTLTLIEKADLLALVEISLENWLSAKGSKETYYSFPAMIDGKIASLTALHAKLDGMLTQ